MSSDETLGLRDLIFDVNATTDRSARGASAAPPEGTRRALSDCRDCDEWACHFCDNESCENNEKEPVCTGAKDIDEGKCSTSRDLQPVCKDCDEYQCVFCDNE